MSKQKSYVKKSGEVSFYDYSLGALKPFKKNGELRKPFLKRVMKELNVTSLSKAEIFDITLTTKRLEKNYIKKGLPGFLTASKVVASYKDDKLMTMLLNTGFTIDQLASMVNTTPEILTDSTNWSFTKSNFFMNEKGELYEFTFDYNSDVLFDRIQ